MSMRLSSLQYISSLYIFSQTSTVKQESLCNIPNGEILRLREAKWLAQRYTEEPGFMFLVGFFVCLLHDHCLSPFIGLENPAFMRFAILPILFMVIDSTSITVLAHKLSICIYSVYIYIY